MQQPLNTTNLLNQTADKKASLVFFLLAIIVVLDRYLVLSAFCFDYVGSDDIIFWLGVQDYAAGVFREPYFYGQDYNFMLEALFAVPLLWCKVPLNVALPISTAFISLFPFVFIATGLHRRKLYLPAYVFLLLPLTLSSDYGLLNSMSRGFVSGNFFMAFLVFAILDPTQKKHWWPATLGAALGYVCNPNSVIFSFPVLLFLWLTNFKAWQFYGISVLMTAPVLALEHLAKQFYKNNPVYNTHPMLKLEFSVELMLKNFGKMDDFYTYYMPFVWKVGSLSIVVLVLFAALLWRKNKLKAISILAAILLLVVSLGINKVNDSIGHLLLSSARMYLAIPLLMGLAMLWYFEDRKLSGLLLHGSAVLGALVLFSIKFCLLDQTLSVYKHKTNLGCVAIKKIKDLQCDCENIEKLALSNSAGFVVFSPTWVLNTPEMMFYAYGCPLYAKHMPTTFLKYCERRSWLFEKEKSAVYANVLFYGMVEPSAETKAKFAERLKFVPGNPDYVMITGNTLRNDSLFAQLGIEYGR